MIFLLFFLFDSLIHLSSKKLLCRNQIFLTRRRMSYGGQLRLSRALATYNIPESSEDLYLLSAPSAAVPSLFPSSAS